MTETTKELKDRAEADVNFAQCLVTVARRRGCDVDAEGPSFRHYVAAEYLGRQGVTPAIVTRQAS